MVGVVDDRQLRKHLTDRVEVGLTHIDGHGLELGPAAFEPLQKRDQRLGVATLLGVEDGAGLQIHDHRHVVVALANGKLVDGNVAHAGESTFGHLPFQMAFVDVLDRVPPHRHETGHMADGGELAQLDDVGLHHLHAAPFAFDELDGFPQGLSAPATLLISCAKYPLRLGCALYLVAISSHTRV